MSPFDSSRSKIARGKKHIKDLQEEIRTFELSALHCMTAESDPTNADALLHKVKLNPVPRLLSDIASDAACNLRDALDHAVYAASQASGKVRPKNAAFPFSGSRAHFEQNGMGRCKDAPSEIKTLLYSFKPYKGGNNLLWALSVISNTNKHVVLVPMGVGASNRVVQATSVGRGHTVFDPPDWDAANSEIVLASSWSDSDFHCNVEVTFSVAFDEVEFVKGKPAFAVFEVFTHIVESIVSTIEAETRSLFPTAFQ
jgi:hypothetical protein